MRLRVVRMVGDVAFGWDGYGHWCEITLSPRQASQVRQQLCYVREVEVRP